MGVYVFTKKEAALKTAIQTAEFVNITALPKHTPGEGDISYIDVCSIAAADVKKTLTLLKKRCKAKQSGQDTPWGIIDPKGSVKDPAALFFE